MSFLSRVMVLKSKAHFSASTTGVYTDHAAFEGARKKRAAQAKSRVGLLIFGFVAFMPSWAAVSCNMAWRNRKQCRALRPQTG